MLKMPNGRKNRGSLTVEAVLIVPIFIAVVLFLSYFLKVYLVHAIVQNALEESVMKLSSMHYAYSVTGLSEFSSNLEEEVSVRVDQIKDGSLEAMTSDEILDTAKKAAIVGTVESVEQMGTKGIIQSNFAKSLSRGEGNILQRLKALGIEGGLEGFCFDESIFYGEDGEIDVRVTYVLKKVDPFNFLSGTVLTNRVSCNVWASGIDLDNDGIAGGIAESGNADSGEDTESNRELRTVYVIADSSTSIKYHFIDCPSLRVAGDKERYKSVEVLQVYFMKDENGWHPEGGVRYKGVDYVCCGNCLGGFIRMKENPRKQ